MASITSSRCNSGQAEPERIGGACLCGAVVFDLRPSHQYGADRAMGYCHCIRCQRWSGGAGFPFVVAVPDHFRVIRGQELIAHYRDQSATVRAFCRYCGSSLFQDTGTTYFVGAGVLHDLNLVPGFHINVTHKAEWDHIAGEAPQFAEMPMASAARRPRASNQP
jgi:hypothetical protein